MFSVSTRTSSMAGSGCALSALRSRWRLSFLMSSRIASPSGSFGPNMRQANKLRRRFVGLALVACLPLPARAAERPILPFEFDAARNRRSDLDVARIARAASRRVLMVVAGNRVVVPAPRPVSSPPIPISSATAHELCLAQGQLVGREPQRSLSSSLPGDQRLPACLVLDSGGRLLHSQDTEELETTKNYDPAAVRAFLVKWAPAR